MTDFEYIKKFSKITVKNACNKNKIDYSNLLAHRTTPENYKKVREEIESEFAKLYIKKDIKNETNIL